MSDLWFCRFPECKKLINNGLGFCLVHRQRVCTCGKRYKITMRTQGVCGDCASAKRRASRGVA